MAFVSDEDIQKLVNEVFSSEGYTEVKVQVDEDSKKGMHYGSFLKFMKVVTIDNNNQREEHHIAVKFGKSKVNQEQQKLPRESDFFQTILPLLLNVQKDMKLQNSFNEVPKCYNTSTRLGVETLILENVNKKGYEIIRGEHINDHNIRLVLKTVAKFHALSFATSIIKAEEFKSAINNYDMLLTNFLISMKDIFGHRFNKIKEYLEVRGRLDLLEKFNKLMQNFNEDSALNILKEKVKESVITHGDLHNLNVMFKYEKEDDLNASEAMLIDFQVSGYHSPVIDLSYYFCFALTPETSHKTIEYLQYYHQEFSSFLNQIHGLVAEELFPFSVLLDHWRRYSFFGFAFLALFSPMLFVAKAATSKSVNESKTNVEVDTAKPVVAESETKSSDPKLSNDKEVKQRTDTFRSMLLNEDAENDKEYQELLMKITETFLLYPMDI